MMTDLELARDIAEEAGRLLLAIRDERAEEGKALGKRGDKEANALILARLRAERPADFILSEEAADDRTRCAASRVWIVDPLDGTREYGEGRDDWAVHVGLSIDGVPVTGAVAIPASGKVYGGEPLTLGACPQPIRVLVSRSRAADVVLRAIESLGAKAVPMGSAGAKAMAVIEGRADAYLHAGGQYEWDNCAPVAVALAAGLHASRIDGSPIVYNCVNTLVPDVLICRPDLTDQLLAAVAEVSRPIE